MTTPVIPPDLQRIIDDLQRRVANLERAGTGASTVAVSDTGLVDVPFSPAGDFVPSISRRYYPPVTRRLRTVFFSLETVGTGDCTFYVLRTGGALTPASVGPGMSFSGTLITMTAGTQAGRAFFDDAFNADADYLQIQIASVGAAADGLDAQARFAA